MSDGVMNFKQNRYVKTKLFKAEEEEDDADYIIKPVIN